MENTIENAQEAELPASNVETTTENPQGEVEQTISELIPEKEEKSNMVPESVFLGEKKARKALEKEIKELKQQFELGNVSNKEVSNSVEAIAEKHGVDQGFLKDLVSAIKSDTEKELESKFNSKFESKEKAEKFENAFKKGLDLALERGPEFKNIVNPEVVKQLAMLPQNANKTISQLIEETYGNALTGKRTIEVTTPGGGKDPEPLDINRAGKDIEYLKEILKDPKKKEQYNEAMLKKGF